MWYKNFRFKNIFFLAVLSLGVYFDVANWHSSFLGWLLLAIYLFTTGEAARQILVKLFNLSTRAWRVKILGMFLSMVMLGWVAGVILLIFGLLTAVGIASAFFVSGLIIYGGAIATGPREENIPDWEHQEWEILLQAPRAKVGLLLYVILIVAGFVLLIRSESGGSIASPWLTISYAYVYVFAAATFILGLLIFSKLPAKTILFLCVLQAFLLHSYLPMTHKLVYGADQWRHIANEGRVVVENKFLEVVISPEGDSVNPASKVNLLMGRLSYDNFWGTSAILSRLLSADLLAISKWFMPIVWSVVLPIILFELGLALGWNKRQSLLLAWGSALPFALQVCGALTLPANLSFLYWLLFVVLFLRRLSEPRKWQVWFLLAMGIGSLCGYLLYAVLFWLGWGMAEVVNSPLGRGRGGLAGIVLEAGGLPRRLRLLAMTLTAVAAAVAIPVLELVAGYSRFAPINWWGQIKQLFGNLTGYYLASGPRPHDIETGNIIFNQTPSYAFVVNWFTSWRWWIVVFMVLFWGLVIGGIVTTLRDRESRTGKWLGMFSIAVYAGYIISRYFLTGENILARRLDVVLALFSLVLVGIAINHLMAKYLKFDIKYWILFIFIITIAVAASYSLGPDTNTVTTDEYKAMTYVWAQEKNKMTHCVLADTYPLLALEAISNKEIVGGGFPIDSNFAQPEREQYFRYMMDADFNSGDTMRLIAKTEGFTDCWFVARGGGLKFSGDVTVLRYHDGKLREF